VSSREEDRAKREAIPRRALKASGREATTPGVICRRSNLEKGRRQSDGTRKLTGKKKRRKKAERERTGCILQFSSQAHDWNCGSDKRSPESFDWQPGGRERCRGGWEMKGGQKRAIHGKGLRRNAKVSRSIEL